MFNHKKKFLGYKKDLTIKSSNLIVKSGLAPVRLKIDRLDDPQWSLIVNSPDSQKSKFPCTVTPPPAELWPLHMDWAPDVVSEQPPTMGCHSAGMHPSVHYHRICQQPSHHHHLPAHPVQPGKYSRAPRCLEGCAQGPLAAASPAGCSPLPLSQLHCWGA